MKNLLYIHIPKTGGVTINNTLKKGGYTLPHEHYFSKDIKDLINNQPNDVLYGGKSFDDFIKFTTVRDPWSKLLSVYTFLTKGSNIHRPSEHIFLNKLGVKSFDEFIRKIYELNKGGDDVFIYHTVKSHIVNLYIRKQTNWVFDDEGNQLVDYICKLDNLSDDIKTFNKEFGFNIELVAPQNISKHNHYTEMYNDETRKMVEELYIEDITAFNFKY